MGLMFTNLLTTCVSHQGVARVLICLIEKQLEASTDKLFHEDHPFPYLPGGTHIKDIFDNPPTGLELKVFYFYFNQSLLVFRLSSL